MNWFSLVFNAITSIFSSSNKNQSYNITIVIMCIILGIGIFICMHYKNKVEETTRQNTLLNLNNETLQTEINEQNAALDKIKYQHKVVINELTRLNNILNDKNAEIIKLTEKYESATCDEKLAIINTILAQFDDTLREELIYEKSQRIHNQ